MNIVEILSQSEDMQMPRYVQLAGKDEMKKSVRMSIPFTEITERSGAKREIPSLDACMLVVECQQKTLSLHAYAGCTFPAPKLHF